MNFNLEEGFLEWGDFEKYTNPVNTRATRVHKLNEPYLKVHSSYHTAGLANIVRSYLNLAST